MARISLHRLTTPGAYSPRVVFVVAALTMLLIFVFDMVTVVNIRLYSLYVFPLAAIAVHSERKVDSVAGVMLSLVCQVLSSLNQGISDVGLKADAVVFLMSSSLVVYLARAARENYLEKASHAASDWLTGLHNRRSFEAILGAEITRQKRYPGVFSLAIVDLDRFKALNDTRGHHTGDKALKLLADILRENTRESDSTARLGGDEFAIIMPNTREEDCRVLCKQLSANIATRMSDANFGITASVGHATFEQPPESTSAALHQADKAMYAAKSTGNDAQLGRTIAT